ncbi:MAG: TolC family protein [Acidobacteria bacterium]|nr:TolC family protein [Acidobacteriota bacterium]
MLYILVRFLCVSFCAQLLLAIGLAAQPASPAPQPAAAGAPQTLSLDECLRITMEKNHRRPASRFAVALAEAQHRQALAGYWPQVNAKAGWFRMDEAPNFVFPAGNMYIPSQTVTVPGGSTSVTIPANAFGPGFPPVAVQMPVSFPGQSITTNAQVFPIPEQDVKLMDPQSVTATGNFTWLLFDGGMRSGYRQQALGGRMAAQADLRRTDLELTDSVVRLYYGAVLARQLHQLGQDTLARMEVTLELTESLYKNGAGRVNKTDYLDNVVMVETIRSTVAELAKNEAAAQAALAYTMGLSWDATVVPASEEVPHRPFAGNAAELVGAAYEFNPDWAKVEAGLKALEGALSTARSGYYPKVALTGEVHRWWNDYSSGTATLRNKTGWTLGVGAEIPVFDGFLTKNRVSEALARIARLKEEKLLLKEGIGLQVRELFLQLEAASKTYQSAERAMVAARENRELTSRAYQNELVDTEKVIRAQLFEALMCAQFYKTRYDQVAIESQLSLVIGKEVRERITSRP